MLGLFAYLFIDSQTDSQIQTPKLSPANVEIAEFRNLINQAVETDDVSICNSLPEPKYEWVSGDDWDARTPTQQEWVILCEALVYEDPTLCEKLSTLNSGSNLDYSCKLQLDK